MKEDALEFCSETISQKRFLEAGWIELCKRLKNIRDNALYTGRWDSFEDFLTDPSMDMDKGTASKMITIHERLILDYQILPEKLAEVGGWSKVAELLPVITDKASAEEWLSTASVLSKADLRKEVRQAGGKAGSIGCHHEKTYQVIWKCCRECDYKEVIKTNE